MRLAVAGGPAGAYVYTGGKAFDPALPAIVFVHGAMHDHSVWTLLARWFANHGHSVLAPDLPGHSKSGGAPLASVEALADWLLESLSAAGVARATLVGHSMGSLVALEAAGRAPDRATALILVGTAFPMAVSPALLESGRSDPSTAIGRVTLFSHSSIAAKPSFPGPGTWLRGADRALMRRIQAAGEPGNLFLNDFEVCNRYAGGLAAAARVTCPATCIVGASDQMTPPAGAVELARVLRARTVVLPAGHAIMTEAPDALLAALRGALDSGRP